MKKTPNKVDAAVGARVRLARLEVGRSQEWLGNALGLTFQQVQKYEKGTNRIGSSRMVQIAAALEKPVTWFFQGSEGKQTAGTDTVTQMLTATGGMDLAQAFLELDQAGRHALVVVARAIAKPHHQQHRKAA